MDAFEARDQLNEPFEGQPTQAHFEAIRVLHDLPADAEIARDPHRGWSYRKPIDLDEINFTITVGT